MAVYTQMKSYRTKGNMGMIDVTMDFQEAVANACWEKKIRSEIIIPAMVIICRQDGLPYPGFTKSNW